MASSIEPPRDQHSQDERATARHVLHAYRERRRERRGEDTYFGSLDCLLERVEHGFTETDRERRRCEVLDDAEREGMPRTLAEKAYEVAREEGLDPGLAIDLVHSGLGVCPPEGGITNAPEEPTTDKYLPEWILPPIPPDELLRERKLRMSFRRLRSLLDEHQEIGDALDAFAEEPDVEPCGY